MNPTLESVRSKIIAAVPEILEASRTYHCDAFGCQGHKTKSPRPIRLADVLLAMQQTSFVINGVGYFFDVEDKEFNSPAVWNLRADDLNQQSEECINFLDQIL